MSAENTVQQQQLAPVWCRAKWGGVGGGGGVKLEKPLMLLNAKWVCHVQKMRTV